MGFFSNFVKNLTKPETLVGAAIATALAPSTGGQSWTVYAKTFAIHAGTSAALQTASQELAGKPKLPDFGDFGIESIGRTQMIKQPIAARRMLYGELRASGVIGHIETTNDDKYLHLIVMVASHEINGFGRFVLSIWNAASSASQS
jgi:hypothetical protein